MGVIERGWEALRKGRMTERMEVCVRVCQGGTAQLSHEATGEQMGKKRGKAREPTKGTPGGQGVVFCHSLWPQAAAVP